jgi:hypothetical protein
MRGEDIDGILHTGFVRCDGNGVLKLKKWRFPKDLEELTLLLRLIEATWPKRRRDCVQTISGLPFLFDRPLLVRDPCHAELAWHGSYCSLCGQNKSVAECFVALVGGWMPGGSGPCPKLASPR